MTDTDTIYIGNKPPMSYVMAVITAINEKGVDGVVLKARGRAISRAVDVAEISRNRYLNDLQVNKIEIGTEQMPTPDGSTHGVSTMAITMEREEVEEAEAEAPPAVAETGEREVAPSQSVGISEIRGVGAATEEKFREAGYTTVKSVAAAEAEELSEKTGISEKVTAKLIDSAKELLR